MSVRLHAYLYLVHTNNKVVMNSRASLLGEILVFQEK